MSIRTTFICNSCGKTLQSTTYAAIKNLAKSRGWKIFRSSYTHLCRDCFQKRFKTDDNTKEPFKF